MNNSAPANILDLDIHSLEVIYTYLSLEDAVNCSEANSYLHWVFVSWARRKYTTFGLLADIAIYELKLLSIIANNLKYLYIDVDDLNLFLSENYSTNKKERVRNGILGTLKRCHCLNTLKLKQYKKNRGVIDILLAVKNAPIKQLHITASKCTAKALSHFKGLETLSLNVKLSAKDLLTVFRSMRHLRALKLGEHAGNSALIDIATYCPQLDELTFYNKPRKSKLNCKNADTCDIFRALANKAKCLESLNVDGVICDLNQVEELARIDNLTRLRCNFTNADCVHALRYLRNLKELRIAYLSFEDMTSIYLNLIRECPQLQVLSIMDFHVPNDFALRAAKVREELLSDSEPMSLIIYGHKESTIRANSSVMVNTITYHRMTSSELLKFL